VLLGPGEIGRDDAGRESIVSGPSGPSLAGVPALATGAAAARASEPSPAPRLADVLRDPAVPATKGDALTVLLGLWGVHAAGGQPDCEGPPTGALECLAAVGSWQKLRRLDLPAALELAGPGGERRYAVLTALTPSEATLRFGDRVVTALLAEVEPFWDGAFVVLWRPPPGELPVRRGASGPATDWLRQRMARAAGAGLPIESGRPYDQGLWERVTAFQEARSLEPDGVVGRETAMVLRRAEWGPDVPRLSAGTP
jgi:general secretion pathway protein A